MASRSDEHGQMILLAGILIVLAYLVYSTQTALLATVGQEAGREASQSLTTDYVVLRDALPQFLRSELTDAAGKVTCPTDATAWAGRVQTLLNLMAQLEANRGLDLQGRFVSTVIPAPPGTLQTTLQLYLTNGDGVVTEAVTYLTPCV